MVLEKTLESPVDSKEIKAVNLQGNQPWIFIGRTDAKTRSLGLVIQYFGHLMGSIGRILWSPHAKSCLIGKDPDAGED